MYEAAEEVQQIYQQQPYSQGEWGYAMGVSNDGSIVVTSCGKNVKIWQFSNGQLKYDPAKFILKAHDKDINTIYYSKKQHMFITGGDDNKIKIWEKDNTNTFKLIQELRVHTKWVMQVIMNENEDQIISVGWDQNLIISKKSNNNQWKENQKFDTFDSQLHSVSINESNNEIVVSSWDQKLYIYNYKQDNWHIKQQIDTRYKGLRVGFVGSNVFIYQPKSEPFFEVYVSKNGGNYEQQPNFNLNQANEDVGYFPIQYNKQNGQIILKHNQYIYQIKKVNNEGKFEKLKQFQYDECKIFGIATPKQDYLLLWHKKQQSYIIEKI